MSVRARFGFFLLRGGLGSEAVRSRADCGCACCSLYFSCGPLRGCAAAPLPAAASSFVVGALGLRVLLGLGRLGFRTFQGSGVLGHFRVLGLV